MLRALFIFLTLPTVLFADTFKQAETFCEWGGSTATISLADSNDHYADLYIKNIISGGHDEIIICNLEIQDLSVTVRVEHQYGNLPDLHLITVSDGFYADITEIMLDDNKELLVKVYRLTALLS